MEDNIAFACKVHNSEAGFFFYSHPHFNNSIYFISFMTRFVFKSAAFDCLNRVAVPVVLLGELLQSLLHILN